MPPRRTPLRLLRTTVALALVAGLSACGGGADPEPAGPRPDLARPDLPSVAEGVSQEGQPKLVNLIVTEGRVSGVGTVVDVEVNTRVRLTVTADVADELVGRGVDARAQLTVDEPVQLTLIMDRAGDFPVALAGSDRVLTTLRVS